MTTQIVLVEDDENIRVFLNDFLTEKGFRVKTFDQGLSALEYMKRMPPDLVILDLGLPTVSGESICKEIKKNFPDTAIIILTAKDSTADIVKGLNLGADDYLTKPFESDELLARIQARLRILYKNTGVLKVSDLELDPQKVEVKRAGKQVHLTTQEFKLLEYLMNHKNKVLSRDMILNRIWLYSYDVDTRVVDVYIGYLRKKIDAGHKNKLIQSIRGFGYSLREPN
jgi:DNA-binding response OmpR family regulator